MKGVILVSHGLLAKGMLDSAHLFLGNDLAQIKACCLSADDSPEDFGAVIKEAIQEVDSGDGVVIFADLFGGTPFNQSLPLLSDKVDLIAGLNFAMLLEYLSKRTYEDVDVKAMVEVGQQGIVEAKTYMASLSLDDDD